MGKLYRRALLGAKIEATPGTDAVPTAAVNAILARDLNFNPLMTEQVDRDFIRPYFGHAGQLVAACRVESSFAVEMAGAGAAGTVPKYSPLLRMAAFAETVNAGVSVVYSPVTTGLESATLYYWLDGLLHKSLYTRSNLELDLTAKQIPLIKLTTTGLYAPVSDVVLPNDSSYAGWVQPLPVNKDNTPTVSLHGVTDVPVKSVSLNMGNTVAARNLINVESVELTNRKAVGKITLEATSVATKDWWAAVKAGATDDLQVVHGTTGGNIVQIDGGKVYLTNPSYSDDEGVAMISFDLAFATTAGNDEVTITVK